MTPPERHAQGGGITVIIPSRHRLGVGCRPVSERLRKTCYPTQAGIWAAVFMLPVRQAGHAVFDADKAACRAEAEATLGKLLKDHCAISVQFARRRLSYWVHGHRWRDWVLHVLHRNRRDGPLPEGCPSPGRLKPSRGDSPSTRPMPRHAELFGNPCSTGAPSFDQDADCETQIAAGEAVSYAVRRARGREWLILPESEGRFLSFRSTIQETAGIHFVLESVTPATFNALQPTRISVTLSRAACCAMRRVRSSAGPFRFRSVPLRISSCRCWR